VRSHAPRPILPQPSAAPRTLPSVIAGSIAARRVELWPRPPGGRARDKPGVRVMLLVLQIAIGTGVLIACSLLHVAVLVGCLPLLRRVGASGSSGASGARGGGLGMRGAALMLSATVLMLVFAHTLQIWLWAALFMAMGQFADLPTSVYFSIVTYTTLGYGDIVLDPYARIIATFAAVTGLITFGISTAVVIAVLGRILPASFRAPPAD
jgi:hypothetical protein